MGMESSSTSSAGSAGWSRRRRCSSRTGARSSTMAASRRPAGRSRRQHRAIEEGMATSAVTSGSSHVRGAGGGRGQPPARRHRRGGRAGQAPAVEGGASTPRSTRAPEGRRGRRRPRRGGRRGLRSAQRLPLPVPDDASIREKIEAVATRCTGPRTCTSMPRPSRRSSSSTATGWTDSPICMAKTHLSLSSDGDPAQRARGIHAAGARHPRLHRRRLARAAGREHPADAGARHVARRVEHRHRRRGPDRGVVLSGRCRGR